MEGCEHAESSPIGKCAICERTVCGDCYQEVFGAMICDQHRGLEDESDWALVGYYTPRTVDIEERRYALEESGVTSLMVETDDETTELYVPESEKEDAFQALASSSGDDVMCTECEIEYSHDLDACPVCGEHSEGRDNAIHD
jgi:hypothetical protein